MKLLAFAKRNFKELVRDPIPYIFCLGFPIVMLVLMTVINQSIPPEANMVIFRIDNLACGIAVFSLSFTALTSALLVSKDRTGAFLTRLYASPMRHWEFVFGYALPLVLVALAQVVITFVFSAVITLFTDVQFDLARAVLSILSLIPTSITFVSMGIGIGFLFSDKSASAFCSIMISLSGLLGGIWFDCAQVGGAIEILCKILPFFNSVSLARICLSGSNSSAVLPLVITLIYTAVFMVFACLSFSYRRKNA